MVLSCMFKIFYPNGPHSIEKAHQIASALGKSTFKGSNGWFEKWKTRYHIKHISICGESGDVQGATVDSWKEKFHKVIKSCKN